MVIIFLSLKNSGIKGTQNIYNAFKVKWGMFSAYDIYDLNFDFYDDTNFYSIDQNLKVTEKYSEKKNLKNSIYFLTQMIIFLMYRTHTMMVELGIHY